MNRKPSIAVLMGGPDNEHDVSIVSGTSVAEALEAADCGSIIPHKIGRISQEELGQLEGDVIFPVLHGPWGEGGPLQEMLEADGRPFVGCGSTAARAAMDKHRAKEIARELGIPTPDWELLRPGQSSEMNPPVVVKPVAEGSSVQVHVTHTASQRDAAISQMSDDDILVEKFIDGRELTVGILDDQTLPIIEIKPASGLYDYEAKYHRDDTVYEVNPDLPLELTSQLNQFSLALSRDLGIRHLCRVDFLLDDHGPWLLEINTMPGFTSHSLLPMAASAQGLELPDLCRQLVQMAISSAQGTVR
ncbi:MAG: D-alanine--D-alanine ligase [Phycisphaerales bacterium]|nr:D-alanine--D-alanine ligase [Phycisphaerales bacterium]